MTDRLVSIKDETGQFLLRLDDGRVIDTKGWAGWEWTHCVGLYGMYQYYRQIPTSMPYGQAMEILCPGEYLRIYL